MHLKALELRDFKRVKTAKINLSSLNVIVGGNNSGKSSVLQGIHFHVTAALASREAGQNTYTQEMLLFCPAHKFELLGHEKPYSNQSHKGFLTIEADLPESQASYQICIYRGRNEGNVGCTRSGSAALAATICDPNKLFSVYVPGLAGVSSFEQYKSQSVVRRGVASGDANLHLRNVLIQIHRRKRLNKLSKLMRNLFPNFSIEVVFEETRDTTIGVRISISPYQGDEYPIELAGTGVLQALQIFSYVTLFEPQLLLLDEPDSHLHPDNQVLLVRALRSVADDTSTQIIVSTHSKHLVEAFRGEANFIWLKAGRVFQQGADLDEIAALMDIGALNDFDRLKNGKIKWLFLSEDTELEPLRTIAEASGFRAAESLYYSYRSTSNFETALSLALFIREVAPSSTVIIHRDGDFMTDTEKMTSIEKILDNYAKPFITEGSDIESYFVSPAHISDLTGAPVDEVEQWLNEVAQANHNELAHAFTRKRDEVKRLLYKKNPEQCPETLKLLGSSIPLPECSRVGKFMLRKVNGLLQEKFKTPVKLLQASDALRSPTLATILSSSQIPALWT